MSFTYRSLPTHRERDYDYPGQWSWKTKSPLRPTDEDLDKEALEFLGKLIEAEAREEAREEKIRLATDGKRRTSSGEIL